MASPDAALGELRARAVELAKLRLADRAMEPGVEDHHGEAPGTAIAEAKPAAADER